MACMFALAGVSAAYAAAPTTASPPVEGRDFILIRTGAPFSTPAGQVEVVEFFNYACPACNSFQPFVKAWKAKLPAYVRFIYIPMDFRADFVQYARAYYAAELFGIAEKSHDAVFQAIHETHKLPGEGAQQDADTIARFYKQYGVDEKKFAEAMSSFSVQMKVSNGRQYAQRSQVSGTPTMLVDGRYLVRGNSWQDTLRITSDLIAQVRAAKPPGK